MSVLEVRVPEVGESITEGVLAEWKFENGAVVAAGEPLFVLETDKVTMDIAAEEAGRLETLVKAGSAVEVGQVVARIDTAVREAGEGAPGGEAAPAAAEQGVPKTDSGPAAVVPPAGVPQAHEKIARLEERIRMTPVARRMAEEHGLDPASLPAAKEGRRITKADVLAYIESNAGFGAEPGAGPAAGLGAGPAFEPGAGPAAGLGAGPAAESPAGPAAERPAGVRAAPIPEEAPETSPSPGPRQTREPMSPMRRRIAERLVEVQRSAAILTTFNEVDMSAVIAWREDHGEEFRKTHGVKLGFMSFFVKAVVEALEAEPAMNAFIDGGEIVRNHYYDIGIAVSTEKGLVVPVLRGAGRLGFAAIEKALASLADRARRRALTLADLQGAVFTISNGGVYGNLLSTPIINPPQSGILGMHAIKKRPVVVDGGIVIRPMMYLALSYDHRLIDGREAVLFLKRIKASIEDPRRLLLNG